MTGALFLYWNHQFTSDHTKTTPTLFDCHIYSRKYVCTILKEWFLWLWPTNDWFRPSMHIPYSYI